MVTKLGEARAQARALFRSGDFQGALSCYDQILAAMPLDFEARFKIADVLAAAGRTDEAAQVYRTVAIHDIRSGHPLPALVACEALRALGQPTEDIFALLAGIYASGSPQLARFAVRQAPAEPEATLPPVALDDSEPFEDVVERAHRRALDLSVIVSYQEQYHPLPFFSELGHEALLAVITSLEVKRYTASGVMVRQGEVGTALYLVASGEVMVFTRVAEGTDRELARLYENSLFGEMALITDQPRAASVAVVDEADIIVVSRAALHKLTARLPAINEALGRFTRERLIKNLLASSPLFTPFTKAQQADLLRRFEGLDVAAGTEIISEGQPGRGLFVVLFGKVEVIKKGAGEPVTLATLYPGDVFGEMSLITDQPTSATVRAATATTVLALARGYFERLAAAVPEVRSYFETVALDRARDNSLRLGRRAVPDDPIEIDITDAILL